MKRHFHHERICLNGILHYFHNIGVFDLLIRRCTRHLDSPLKKKPSTATNSQPKAELAASIIPRLSLPPPVPLLWLWAVSERNSSFFFSIFNQRRERSQRTGRGAMEGSDRKGKCKPRAGPLIRINSIRSEEKRWCDGAPELRSHDWSPKLTER